MRIRFQSGQQEKFINYCLQKLDYNLRELAEKIKIDYWNIKKYHKEKSSLAENVFIKLCKISGINSGSLEISKFPDNLGQIIGGKRGIISMKKKYPGKLKKWRAKGGKNHARKKVNGPTRD